MNPLAWKREHQIALLVAMGVGGILGTVADINLHNTALYFYWPNYCCPTIGTRFEHFASYWLRPLVWPGMGAIIGGALVYIRRLLG